jgi:hypothetical protein
MWLQEGPDLNGWENRTENIDGIMISDVEYEVGSPLRDREVVADLMNTVCYMEERR